MLQIRLAQLVALFFLFGCLDVANEPSGNLIDGALASEKSTSFKFIVEDGVTNDDFAPIAAGVDIGRSYFTNILEVAQGEFDANKATIRVVATGKGTPGNGFCCSVNTRKRSAQLMFLDVRNVQWVQRSGNLGSFDTERSKIVVHEMVHILQAQLGAIDKMPNWMLEGTAEYLALDAFIRRGHASRNSIHRFLLQASISSDEMSRPLKAYAPESSPAWPGHVGSLVIAGLFDYSGRGPSALVDYTRLIGQRRSHDSALQAAFGISEDELYELVEAWRKGVEDNAGAQPLWSRS